MIVVLFPFLADFHRVRRVAGKFLQVLLRQPALYARTSFISFYESDGDVQCLMHGACEEIASGRKLSDGLGRALAPFALSILLWLSTHHTGDLHASDTLVVGCVDDHLVIVLHWTHPESLDGHLHVRLSCADPDLTCHHILNGQWLTIVKGDRQRFITGLWRLDLHQPLPVLVGLGTYHFICPRYRHLDRFSRLCPSP